MKVLPARSYSPRVDVAREVIILKLHLEVEVPVVKYKQDLKTIDWDVEVGAVRPAVKGGGNGR